MRSQCDHIILPKPAYRIFSCIQWHFQNRICENYAAYPKIHIYLHTYRIFPHTRSHFSAFFLSSICLRPLNIFLLQKITGIYNQMLKKIKSNMSKLCTIGLLILMLIMIMIIRHSNLHMLEMCDKICCIYAAYAAYMCRIFRQISHIFPHISLNFAYFSAYFASKNPAYFKNIFGYKPASLHNADIIQSYEKPNHPIDTVSWLTLLMTAQRKQPTVSLIRHQRSKKLETQTLAFLAPANTFPRSSTSSNNSASLSSEMFSNTSSSSLSSSDW